MLMSAPTIRKFSLLPNSLSARAWNGFAGEGRLPLQQSWAYGEAIEQLGATCHRFVLEAEGQTVGLCQWHERHIAGLLTLATQIRGPLFAPDALPEQRMAARAALAKALRARYPIARLKLCVQTPDLRDGEVPDDFPATRLISGSHTVWLDLAQEEDVLRANLHGKWRNMLKAAEAAPLKIRDRSRDRASLQWLCIKDSQQQKQKGFAALPSLFVSLYQESAPEKEPTLLLTANHGGEPIAGMLFLIHGLSATYHIGWAGEAGREYRAHHRLMWGAIRLLKAKGVRWLDLGGVETDTSPGIARFKLGVGGEVVSLAGTYV